MGHLPGAESKRIRVEVGGETIADSRQVMMLHESGAQPMFYFPPEDVRQEFLRAERSAHPLPEEGRGLVLHDRGRWETVEDGAWYYPEPLSGAPRARGA